MYKIKTISSLQEIDSGEVANIDIYNWGGEYRPKTTAKLCFIENQGFVVKLTCEEKDPLATVLPPVGHVCIDSCVEFFANFKPDIEHSPYINFEANSLGTLCCEFAEKGGLRPRFEVNNIPLPEVSVVKTETNWSVTMFISLDIIKLVYGDCTFKKGDIIKGNFFKCGDKTKTPHYGSYTKIDTSSPSFHQPQFFAEMSIQ